ncbi:related to DNA repair endonuclease rad2 [Rhynchosporium agropyri]|uniref:Related to DNA repair endonuclease rad2 n=1 Tax=Rhynchosporium agropyri TaxID=914238 RepID=A0A1E1JVF4_9HELO|nr:related to DNA repair endonuclease rad2 [Rhynchosporium agropyri]
MGIPGIYEEIGRGERVSLSKLAIEKLEETGRPFRLAIDISIWQFQIQAGQGGANPAIRTLYYRLVRLLGTSIQPLFVFDGAKRPQLKRNKRVGRGGASASDVTTKQLLKLFGFPYHNAPGEAEAECALLQRHGIVDAVLSEDVDTLMFGSGTTLRDWSPEGSRGNKAPTHVSLFDAKKTKEGKSGLGREGMILVALLSGGDYAPDGLKGFGAKIACEAARAGFGKSLCSISKSDEEGLSIWRESLTQEIQTNENKFFKTKHKSLIIPDDFPSKEILGYYTHPVVSSATKIDRLKEDITWDGGVDVLGLREYVKEAFDWTNKGGASKFIRNLAPALLVHQLRLRANRRDSGYPDEILTQMNEMEYVREICGRREHFSMDGCPELRIVFAPLDIVGMNLEDEYDDSEDYGRDGLAPVNGDDQIEAYVSEDDAPVRKRAIASYDPTKLDKIWIPETIAKLGIPLKVEDYEEAERKKRLPKIKAVRKTRTAPAKGGMPRGALDKFVKVTKSVDENIVPKVPARAVASSQPTPPPAFLAPAPNRLSSSQPAPVSKSHRTSRSARSSTEALSRPMTKSRAKTAPIKSRPNGNPWSLAKPTTSSQPNPSITKALNTQTSKSSSPPTSSLQEPYYITSSPLSLPSSLSRTNSRKHIRPQSPSTPPELSEHEIELPSTVTISRGTRKVRPDPTGTPSKSSSQPSPRKKISPGRIAASHLSSSFEGNVTVPSNFEPVARKLSFSAPAGSPSRQIKPQSYQEKPSDNATSSSGNIHTIDNAEIENEDETEDYGDFPSINEMLSPSPMPAIASTSSFSASSTPISTSKSISPKNNIIIDLDSSPPAPIRAQTSHPKFGLYFPSCTSSSVDEKSAPDVVRTEEMVTAVKKGKRFITLRESLEGSWKEISEEEMLGKEKEKEEKEKRMTRRGGGRQGKGAWRMSEVEVLDLTGD